MSASLVGAVALIVLATQSAAAVTLTFDTQAPATGVIGLDEKGFEVTGTGARHYVSSGGSSFCAPACPNNGSNHLLGFDAAFDITSPSGDLFSVAQLDIAESHVDMEQYWAQIVRVTGTYSDASTVSVDLQLDFVNDGDGPLADFQTESLPGTFVDLASLRIEGILGASRSGFSVDNIVVSVKPALELPLAPASRVLQPVPEPATMALMMLALAGLGMACSRRARAEPSKTHRH